MSSFTCICGHVTHDRDEPPGTTLVAYSLPNLNKIEHRITKKISEFLALPAGEQCLAWQHSFYETDEIREQSTLEVIEDIVSREFNESFLAVYRCPACNRIAMKDASDSDGPWLFFHPECKKP